jgi:hypothetical protein
MLTGEVLSVSSWVATREGAVGESDDAEALVDGAGVLEAIASLSRWNNEVTRSSLARIFFSLGGFSSIAREVDDEDAEEQEEDMPLYSLSTLLDLPLPLPI